MKLKNFLLENKIKYVQTVDNKILNLVMEDSTRVTLKVDISNITAGLKLNDDYDFILTENNLISNGIQINLNEEYVLVSNDINIPCP